VTLGVFLFATYFVFVPGIIKQYENKLAKEREKLSNIVTRLELQQIQLEKAIAAMEMSRKLSKQNNTLLQEIKRDAASDSETSRSKNN